MRVQRIHRVVGMLVAMLVFFGAVVETVANGDSQIQEFMSMSLDDLLNKPITVASGVGMSSRESPGIVTVITRDQIEKWGSQDLVDILRMIPGFDVESDITGLLGIGVRGLWATEGKVLVLIDGVPMNDPLYNSVSLGRHFPADMVESIEIIRGPGSAMYGGAAELGVIKITTLAAKKKLEGRVSATYGLTADVVSRRMGSAFAGGKEDDLAWSVYANVSDGHFSDRTATDWDGWSWDTGADDASLRKDVFVDTGIQYHDLSLRFIADEYTAKQDYFGYYKPFTTEFSTYVLDAKYDIKASEDLTVTPHVEYRSQEPWKTPPSAYDKGDGQSIYSYEVLATKLLTEVSGTYALGPHNIQGGVSYEWQDAEDKNDAGNLGGLNDVSYEQFSAYGQGLFKTPIALVTAGARYEDHSAYGSAFAPRLALTRQFGIYHAKLLASRAFRSPSIANNADIEPEDTAVYEMEGGVQLSRNSILTVNIFDQAIDKPIVYTWAGSSAYENGDSMGSRGAEAVFQQKAAWGDLYLSYSYAQITDNSVPEYAVPGDDDNLLGFPTHKVTGSISVSPISNLSLTPSVMFVSQRWGITAMDASGAYIYEEFDPAALVNLNALYKNAFVKSLDVSLGIRNIFNEDFHFIQAYPGYDGPIPDGSRELYVKLAYAF